mmetsp:Transcript_8369/g.22340  ORF Transcript_8369/g.22340 Transcript_8369/m.22340 type:complete len:222 (-) Transcript_8369:2232-2897(-)
MGANILGNPHPIASLTKTLAAFSILLALSLCSRCRGGISGPFVPCLSPAYTVAPDTFAAASFAGCRGTLLATTSTKGRILAIPSAVSTIFATSCIRGRILARLFATSMLIAASSTRACSRLSPQLLDCVPERLQIVAARHARQAAFDKAHQAAGLIGLPLHKLWQQRLVEHAAHSRLRKCGPLMLGTCICGQLCSSSCTSSSSAQQLQHGRNLVFHSWHLC